MTRWIDSGNHYNIMSNSITYVEFPFLKKIKYSLKLFESNQKEVLTYYYRPDISYFSYCPFRKCGYLPRENVFYFLTLI